MINPISNFTIYPNLTKCSGVFQYVNGSSLTVEQRVSFSVVVLMLMLLAVVTNLAMVFVTLENDKNQTFFRVCLISLACSDLMSSLLTGVNYFAQYIAEFNNVWTLGSLSCKLFPLFITAAILANGFTLVGISFSRYLAVIKLTKWEFSQKFCILATILIWSSSMGIAGPSIVAYQAIDVYILNDISKDGRVIHLSCGQMCISNMAQNTIYYSVLFGILFVPTFVAFLWFNGVLAREIWRRHRIAAKMQLQQKSNQESSNMSNDANPLANTDERSSTNGNECTHTACASSQLCNRRGRHFRMFCIIVLLTLMYLALKLPQWLVIMLSVYNDMAVANVILKQYLFGILSMVSAVINPILYAFLTQTVKQTVKCYRKVISYILRICKTTGVALSSVIEPPPEELSE